MYDTSLKRKWDTANVIDYARKEGEEQKSYTVVANLIQQLGLANEAASGVAEVSVDFVRKVRNELGEKKK